MADIVRMQDEALPETMASRWRDMLDTTHAVVRDIGDRAGRLLGVVTVGNLAASPVYMVGLGDVITTTLTLPAAVQYHQNDEISDNAAAPTTRTITNAARANGLCGYISSVFVISSINQATKPDIEAYIFQATPTTGNDHVAFALTDVEAATLCERLTVNNWYAGDPTVGTGGNSTCRVAIPTRIKFKCAANSRNLYLRFKILNTYTPVANQVFTYLFGIDWE